MTNLAEVGYTLPNVSKVVVFKGEEELAAYLGELPNKAISNAENLGSSTIFHIVIGGQSGRLIASPAGCSVLILLGPQSA